MTIVCGTDLSEASLVAARVAALLAARTRTPLHLVLSSESSSNSDEGGGATYARAKDELNRASERLADTGAEIHVHRAPGAMPRCLVGIATEVGADLIVVGAVGRGRTGERALGSQADQLAHSSHVPVLIVRDREPFEAWVAREKPLRVLLAADFTLTSRAAASWVAALCQLGPCEVTAAHVYFPPDEYQRLGLSGPRTYAAPNETILSTLEGELQKQFGVLDAAKSLKWRIEPHIGRTGVRLASIGAKADFDLVVVGSHARNTIQRLWYGSVSHDVVWHAPASVTCVPSAAAIRNERAVLRTVVAATDFSRAGNSAVSLAYGVAPPGATIHVVHVLPRGDAAPLTPSDVTTRASLRNVDLRRDALDQLRILTAAHEGGSHLTEIHVLESSDPAVATSQVAERWNADLICLGTHDHGPASAALMGSVARRLFKDSRRPVLFARAPAE